MRYRSNRMRVTSDCGACREIELKNRGRRWSTPTCQCRVWTTYGPQETAPQSSTRSMAKCARLPGRAVARRHHAAPLLIQP